MSLVGYEYSDDEEDAQVSGEEEIEIPPKDVSKHSSKSTNSNNTNNNNVSNNKVDDESKDTAKANGSGLFKQMPPIQSVSTNLSKDDVKRTASGRIQIAMPSLSMLNQEDSDDDSEEEERRKRLKRSDQGSRLISMLPQPKNKTNSNSSNAPSSSTSSLTSLIPNSVSNRSKAAPSVKSSQISSTNIIESNSSNDKRSSNPSSFFFTNDDDDDDDEEDEVGVKIPFADQLMNEPFVRPSTSQPPVAEYSDAPVYGPAKPEPVSAIVGDSLYSPDESMALDPNQDITYKKFVASKFGEDPAESIKFVDFDMSKHLSQNQDWLKNITVEQSVKDEDISGPTPNATARRKNQITFLAYQAKKREVDLKNQWAQNKQSKNQTRAKYGF